MTSDQRGWGHPQPQRTHPAPTGERPGTQSPREAELITQVEREIALAGDRSADRGFVGVVVGGVVMQALGVLLGAAALIAGLAIDGVGPSLILAGYAVAALLLVVGSVIHLVGLLRLLHTIQATYRLVRRL